MTDEQMAEARLGEYGPDDIEYLLTREPWGDLYGLPAVKALVAEVRRLEARVAELEHRSNEWQHDCANWANRAMKAEDRVVELEQTAEDSEDIRASVGRMHEAIQDWLKDGTLTPAQFSSYWGNNVCDWFVDELGERLRGERAANVR